jgi:chromosome partitioning protein
MNCGWDSPEQIAACLHFVSRWSSVFVNLIGLGTFALISILVWLFGRLRKDLSKWEDESKRANELRRLAEEAARHAEHRVELAEREAARDRRALEELQSIASSSENVLKKELVQAQTRLAHVTGRLDQALELTAGGTERFWSRPVGNRFVDYEHQLASSIPILLFGNQKGGVGKSTTVTNLAAAFAAKGERVLTVDLDYQGSHSSLVQLQLGQDEPESLIDFLFEDSLDANWSKLAIRKVTENLHYIPAFYNFELIERRVEYRWALGATTDDARYRLARALLSRDVQERFDRVLIDAPPRFTLGFVNGFCAATHLYVPTVVDLLSASAVGSFARQFRELRAIVNPRIQWAGIIGTLTFLNTKDPLSLPGTAESAADAAEGAAQSALGTQERLFIRNPVIVRDANLARATEKGIAYLNDSNRRPMFDALAAVIESKAPRKTKS